MKITRVCEEQVALTTENTIEGYANTFDPHPHGDETLRILPGAWKKTISETKPGDVPLLTKHMVHGGDGDETVALINSLKEDEKGLYITATWLPDEHSQTIRKKAIAKAIKYFSVGFTVIKQRIVNGVREIVEAAIDEVTLTNFPANKNSVVVAALSESTCQADSTEASAAITLRKQQAAIAEAEVFLLLNSKK